MYLIKAGFQLPNKIKTGIVDKLLEDESDLHAIREAENEPLYEQEEPEDDTGAKSLSHDAKLRLHKHSV